jgi:hypothetical protein
MGAIVIGAIFLAIGLTVRVYPNILAGYGNLSQKERETAETNGLPFFGFLLFTAMGVITLLSYGVSLWLNDPNLSSKNYPNSYFDRGNYRSGWW